MSVRQKWRSIRKKTISKDQDHESEGEAADEENDKSTHLDPVIEGLTTITKEIRDLKKETKEIQR